jgi:hypothetical protein
MISLPHQEPHRIPRVALAGSRGLTHERRIETGGMARRADDRMRSSACRAAERDQERDEHGHRIGLRVRVNGGDDLAGGPV